MLPIREIDVKGGAAISRYLVGIISILSCCFVQAAATEEPSKRYIVELHEPSVAAKLLADAESSKVAKTSLSSAKFGFRSDKATIYRAALTSTQRKAAANLQKTASSITILKQYQTLLNGFAVRVPESEIANIVQLTEVKRVFVDAKRYVTLDSTHELTGTVQAWQALGGQSEAGKGIKIAIIDSGIRNDNPMFFGEGFAPVDLSDNAYLAENPDYCRAESGEPSFCNNKIIIARWMDPVEHDLFNIDAGEYMSPLGFNRHGSHVAGIAAGNPVSVEYDGVPVDLVGVAPGSYLMVYKALYASGGVTYGTDSMLLEALEHAVNDGADVINNSWGSFRNESPEDSIYAGVFANAEAMGIVIVNSAGNSGGIDGGAINCPGCIESGITVANTMHGRFFAHALWVEGNRYLATQGENDALSEDLSLPLYLFSQFGLANSDGCEYPFDEPYLTGGMLLVDHREQCSLADIAMNAQQAGADALLVYQSGVADSQARGPFEPYIGDYALPILGVSRASGLRLFELASTGLPIVEVEASVGRYIDPLFSDTFNPSSSSGPNVDSYILKPDLAAPGTDILSASAPEADFSPGPFDPFPPFPEDDPLAEPNDSPVFELVSGTSMSSPYVAGAVALIKQQHPNWQPQHIKSALMSTANQQVYYEGSQVSPFEIGAGRVALDVALDAQLGFTPASLADGACIGYCELSLMAHNMTDQAQVWRVDLSFDDQDIRAKASVDALTLEAIDAQNNSASIDISIDTTNVALGTWVFGQLTLSNEQFSSQHLPVAIYANDNSDQSVLNSYASVQDSKDIDVSIKLKNVGFSDEPKLTIPIPSGANFVQSSESVTVISGHSQYIEYDVDSHQLYWQGFLEQGSMSLNDSLPFDTYSLAEREVTPVSCSQGCRYFTTTLDFEFEYNGDQYSSLVISSDGYAVPGGSLSSSLFGSGPRALPQDDEQNNIIAPLWASYDLEDTAITEDSGNGFLRTEIVTIEGNNYLIIEWDQVELIASSSNDEDEPTSVPSQYSFQLIVQQGTDNIWFHYLSIPELVATTSIGAEDNEGRIGVNYYFDGQGVGIPEVSEPQAYTLKLDVVPTGQATIQFGMQALTDLYFAYADSYTLNEDTSTELDVLVNDTGSITLPIEASLDAGNTYHTARVITLKDDVSLVSSSLEIIDEPEFGQASVLDGKIVYQPAENYTGRDSLLYRVADAQGLLSQATVVTLNVANVNDAPSVEVDSQSYVNEGERVTFIARASDPDDQPLSYEWQQTAGEIVSVSQQNNEISFTAPNINKDTTFSFKVVVSDGELNDERTVSIKVINRNAGSLGSAIMAGLFLLLFFGATKKEARKKEF